MTDTFLTIMLAIGGLGLYILYRGWTRRIVDGGMYCRHCDYRIDQSGEGIKRCSECGLDLEINGAIRPYRPHRNSLLIIIGLSLMTFCSGIMIVDATSQLSARDIYRWLPSWYLIRTDVSNNNRHGDMEVDILRDRVQDGSLSESQLQQFTSLLAQRATVLHTDTGAYGMQYTGMTLSLLKRHKPAANETDALLAVLLERFLINNGASVKFRPTNRMYFESPVIVLQPVAPFLTSFADSPQEQLRADIRSIQLEVAGKMIEPSNVVLGLASLDQARVFNQGIGIALRAGMWHIAFETADVPNGDGGRDVEQSNTGPAPLPSNVRLQFLIDWYIEDIGVPPTTRGPGKPNDQPWHTQHFSLQFDLSNNTGFDWPRSFDNSNRPNIFTPHDSSVDSDEQ